MLDKAPKNYIWYKLLTDEKLFSNCKKVNEFALRFLNRSFYEAVVEVEVSNLKGISPEKRPMIQKTTEMLNFIATNGPHPLVNLVESILNSFFGKKWHFTISKTKYLV